MEIVMAHYLSNASIDLDILIYYYGLYHLGTRSIYNASFIQFFCSRLTLFSIFMLSKFVWPTKAQTFLLVLYFLLENNQVGRKFGESKSFCRSMLSDGQVGKLKLKDRSTAAMSTFGYMLPGPAAGPVFCHLLLQELPGMSHNCNCSSMREHNRWRRELIYHSNPGTPEIKQAVKVIDIYSFSLCSHLSQDVGAL